MNTFGIIATFSPPDAVMPPGAENLTTIVAWVLGIVGVAGFLGLIIIAITMFFASRQGNDIGDTGRKLGMWAGGITLVGAAGAIVSALL